MHNVLLRTSPLSVPEPVKVENIHLPTFVTVNTTKEMLCNINIILTLTERCLIDWLYVLLKIIIFFYCRVGLHKLFKNVVATSKFLASKE